MHSLLTTVLFTEIIAGGIQTVREQKDGIVDGINRITDSTKAGLVEILTNESQPPAPSPSIPWIEIPEILALGHPNRHRFETTMRRLDAHPEWEKFREEAIVRYPVYINGQPHYFSQEAVFAVIAMESEGNPYKKNSKSSARGLFQGMTGDDETMMNYFRFRERDDRPILSEKELKYMPNRKRKAVYCRAMFDPEIAHDYGVRHLRDLISAHNRMHPENPVYPDKIADIRRILAINNLGPHYASLPQRYMTADPSKRAALARSMPPFLNRPTPIKIKDGRKINIPAIEARYYFALNGQRIGHAYHALLKSRSRD